MALIKTHSRGDFSFLKKRAAVIVASVLFFHSIPLVMAQEEDDDVRPSPASIGTDIPVTYFGPPPSSVEPELIGDLQLLTAGVLDEDAGTITLPLYRGELYETGENIWYIITDTTDAVVAEALGLNHSAKLAFAENDRAVRDAMVNRDGVLRFFAGSVDFSPERLVVPGNAENSSAAPFPLSQFQPGAIGDELYSPLVKIINNGGHIYNAPMVAYNVDEDDIDFCEGNVDYSLVHDRVISICPEEETVTLSLSAGFSFARPVLYLSTDANDPLPAALEGGIFAPGLRDVAVGRDDSLFSAVERLFTFVNGPANSNSSVNPQRQGLGSAVLGEGDPLNVLGGIPTFATDYSPLWDLNVGEWTQLAIDRNYRSRLTEEFQILGFVERGFITGPGGAVYGSSGFIVNCPIVHRFL